MQLRNRRRRASAFMLMTVGSVLPGLTACDKHQEATGLLPTKAPAFSLIKGSNRRRPAEDRFVQLANEVPGFGGLYLDGTQLVAWVNDSTKVAALRGALASHLALDGFGIPQNQRPTSIVVKNGAYDFQTLSDYRDIVSDSILGSMTGVVAIDLDESVNRVMIRLLTAQAAAKPQVLQRLQTLGVPSAAVVFQTVQSQRPAVLRSSHVRMAMFENATTLVDASAGHPDTLGGGFLYASFNYTLNPSVLYLCTIGIIATSGSTPYLESASHCTNRMYNLTGDTAETKAGVWLGTESSDPSGTLSCTGFGITCWHHRSSDAATYSLSFAGQSASYRAGVIARPNSRTHPTTLGQSRDSTINSSNPWLFVTGSTDASNLYSGETVDKVGAFSGWTYGTITATCVDEIIYDGSYVDGEMKTYCEDESNNMLLREGDSGGSVFLYDGRDGATFIGNVSQEIGSTVTFNGFSGTHPYEAPGTAFSTWSSAVFDLGSLNPVAPITMSGTLSLGGSLSGNAPQLSWSGISVSGTNASTQYTITRSVWDASTYTWINNGSSVATVTSSSYSDGGLPISVYSNVGGSQPNACQYSYAEYTITAYNSGHSATSNTIYYQGDANGANPGQVNCQ